MISQSPLKFPLYLQSPNGISELTIWLSYFISIRKMEKNIRQMFTKGWKGYIKKNQKKNLNFRLKSLLTQWFLKYTAI